MPSSALDPSGSQSGEPAEENEFLVRRALKRASKRARQKKKKAALKAAAAATAAASSLPVFLPPAAQTGATSSSVISARGAAKRTSSASLAPAVSSATAPSTRHSAGAAVATSAPENKAAKRHKVSARAPSPAQSPSPAAPNRVAYGPSIRGGSTNGADVSGGLRVLPAQPGLLPKASKKASTKTSKSKKSVLILNSGSLGPIPAMDLLARAQQLVGITCPHSEAVSSIKDKDAHALEKEIFHYYTFIKESAVGQFALAAVRELLESSFRRLQDLEKGSKFDEDSAIYDNADSVIYENACLEIGAALYSPLIAMLSGDRLYTLMLPGLLPDSKLVLGLPSLSKEVITDAIAHREALELMMAEAVSVCLPKDPRFSPSTLRIGGLSSKVIKDAYSLLLQYDPGHTPTDREISGFEISGGYCFSRLQDFVTWAFDLFVEFTPNKPTLQPMHKLPPINSYEFFAADSEAPPRFSSSLSDRITSTVASMALDEDEIHDYLMLFTGRGIIASGEDSHCGWEFSLILTRTLLGTLNIVEAQFMPSDISGLEVLPFKKIYKCDQCNHSLRFGKCVSFGTGTSALIYCAKCVSSGVPPNGHSGNPISCAATLPAGMSRAFREALTEDIGGSNQVYTCLTTFLLKAVSLYGPGAYLGYVSSYAVHDPRIIYSAQAYDPVVKDMRSTGQEMLRFTDAAAKIQGLMLEGPGNSFLRASDFPRRFSHYYGLTVCWYDEDAESDGGQSSSYSSFGTVVSAMHVRDGLRLDVIFWGDGSRIPLKVPASYYGPKASEIPRHRRFLNLSRSRYYDHGTAMSHAGGLDHFKTYANATVADQ